MARYHSGFAVAVYIAVCAVISLVAWLMPDYTGKDISAEYDEAAPATRRPERYYATVDFVLPPPR